VLIAGGTVDAPIGRHRTERTRMAVTDGGKPAITHYRVIKRYTRHTHIRVQLETGRTHQIRVHMTHLDHPLVGDKVYSRRRYAGVINDDVRAFGRQALHAAALAFLHPADKRPLAFNSPLPDDFTALLAALAAEPKV
jgi:23S rRNA pseudouridine1911/1915/1917 synthase